MLNSWCPLMNNTFDDKNLWESNDIQFPRLLAEIAATQDSLDMEALCAVMDLSELEIDILFCRAQDEWEDIKGLYCPI